MSQESQSILSEHFLDPTEGDSVTTAEGSTKQPKKKTWPLRAPAKKTFPFRPGAVNRSSTRSGAVFTAAGKEVTLAGAEASNVDEILDTRTAKPRHPFVANEVILLVKRLGRFHRFSRRSVTCGQHFDFNQLVSKFLPIADRMKARLVKISLEGPRGYMQIQTHEVFVMARVQEDIRAEVVNDAVDRMQMFYQDLTNKTDMGLELKLSLICVNFLEHVYSALTYPNCLNCERPVRFLCSGDFERVSDDAEYVSANYS